jgi:homogentisate 1,2-dioxygenase
MIDTFHSLKLTKVALEVENRDYIYSWSPGIKNVPKK